MTSLNGNTVPTLRTVIFGLFARLLPTSAVDRAVNTLTKAAAALAAAEQAQLGRVDSYNNQLSALQSKRATALSEAGRARRIADRLNDLTA